MPDYQPLIQWMQSSPEFSSWAGPLQEQLAQKLSAERWGDLPGWQAAIDALPELKPTAFTLKDQVMIGTEADISTDELNQLREKLMVLHPWRKGPVTLFGLLIDTEWRSDWKWQRVLPHLDSLSGRLVLDIGCGNGYHCLRMAGAGAKRVIGIDPSVKFVYQYSALKKYLPDIPVDVLPLGIEDMPVIKGFDSVFSMGVLYHRRNPREHLTELKNLTRSGGQVILETLIIDAEPGAELIPDTRYAKMRNVWSIPSPGTVIQWMTEIGLGNARMVDMCTTSTDEQRQTEWMRFESLADFLNPTDPTKTVEGYPSPIRAVFIAEVP